ncbi:hypothetical protein [Anabaena sp. AL09]|jgi:hypothetical protein|uniref:hypothetical protein n=1 Tax=Anabaena sp. AL09 TaxID=1710891 RepID=UPI0008009506|nr:hypothetical protein [Anabaena sp. AL09]OBQ10577.1 MAG: hypothetical protein AN490_07230 [Anabaena sp. AL09]
MKKQLVISLTLVALSFGMVVTPFSYREEKALAVNFPKFVPGLKLDGNVGTLIIPKDLIEGALRQTLKINEQRLKDTAFNRITLKGTDCKIVGDKLQVSGVIQVEHRELIASILGKKKYTPWVSASGRLTQLFGIQVKNNQTVVRNIGDPKLEGLEGRWYAELVSLAGQYVGPKITPQVTQALSRFNGLDIRQFAIDFGTPLIASKLGISEGLVKPALEKNIGPINAGIDGQSNFIIAFTLPQLK